nr:hypothetical protein [Tanacetum cinerariifolium]
ADYRKLWLHLNAESCGNWVKSVGKNHREEEYQEGNNSPKIETLTYLVLATYG